MSISYSNKERVTWLKEANCNNTFLTLLLPTLLNLVSLDLIGLTYAKYIEQMLQCFGTGAEYSLAFTNLKLLFQTYEQAIYAPIGAIINPGIFTMPFIKRIYLYQVYSGYGDKVDKRLA